MKSLGPEDFLNGKASTLKPQKVPTPEMGKGTFAYVAELDANETDEQEIKWFDHKKTRGNERNLGYRAFVVAYCLCDEQNRRFYNTGEGEELSSDFQAAMTAIAGKGSRLIRRLFDAAASLNGITESDVKELEKNLEATQIEDGKSEPQPA